MSDQYLSKSPTIQVRVISANGLPIQEVDNTVNSFVKISILGPIKSYVGKTKIISKSQDPQWNSELFKFSSVRGTRLLFEVCHSGNISTAKKIAFATYDPNFMPMNGNQGIQLPLTFYKPTEQENTDNPSMLVVSVQCYAFRQSLQLNHKPKAFSNPVYITFDPSIPFLKQSPYCESSNSKDFKPFVFPYEISIIAVNDTLRKYEVICSSNRKMHGIWHSGSNVCYSFSSISQSIRVDPAVLLATGYKILLIAIHTNDYSSLNTHFDCGNIVIWGTKEPPGKYNKKLAHVIERPQIHDIAPVGGFNVIPSPDVPSSIIFVSKGIITNQKDGSASLVFSSCQNGNYPQPNCKDFTAQTPAELVPEICLALHLCDKSIVDNLKQSFTYPLFTSRSLSDVFPLIQSQELLITARASSAKMHKFAATAYDQKFKLICTCNSINQSQFSGSLKFSQDVISADLNKLPNEVSTIFYTIYGDSPLIEEAHGSDKPDPMNERSNWMGAYINKTVELIKCPFKYSRVKNCILWFALTRDAFNGWSLYNARCGVNVKDDNQCLHMFELLLRDSLGI